MASAYILHISLIDKKVVMLKCCAMFKIKSIIIFIIHSSQYFKYNIKPIIYKCTKCEGTFIAIYMIEVNNEILWSQLIRYLLNLWYLKKDIQTHWNNSELKIYQYTVPSCSHMWKWKYSVRMNWYRCILWSDCNNVYLPFQTVIAN